MEGTILRSQALQEIDTGEPFDMEFVACDRKRGTGGELIHVKGWQKMSARGQAEQMPGRIRKAAISMLSKNPNHWEHRTINIFNPLNRGTHPIKVHFRLIQFFNGKRVLNG